MTITNPSATMRHWVLRREKVGKPWTVEQLRERIARNYPTMPPEDQERVYLNAVLRSKG